MTIFNPKPALSLALASLLSACASPGPPPAGEWYRCDQALEFRVRFVDDSAVIDSPRGLEILLRDAGGLTPQQSVFSNPRVRVEFGLGANTDEALLHDLQMPLDSRCVRVARR